MAMSSTDMVSEIGAFMADLVPEMNVAEAPKEKKKKKKEKKGVDIEDMYSFDIEKIPAAKPVKTRKKEETTPGEVSQKDIARTLKAMAKMIAKDDESNEAEPNAEKEESKIIDEQAQKLLRFPSPSRSRQGSPKKEESQAQKLLRFPSPSRSRQGSPKKEREEQKIESTLKATAFEFVPPGVSPGFAESPKKEQKVESDLKATATEFVPPGFSAPTQVTSSLQAGAAEFVPPAFEPEVISKVSKPTCPVEEKQANFAPPTSDVSSEACWAHAVLTPSTSLESVKQQQPQVSALEPSACEPSTELHVSLETAPLNLNSSTPETTPAVDGLDDPAKKISRLDVGNILGKVKQSLTSQLGRLVPNSVGENAKDPCLGKVGEKVKKIEEKEADNEAEKQREAALKAAKEAQSAQQKEYQMEMDETLMDCFLQAVTTRIKDRDLPIMGTTLYGKHMRSSRRIGTSCDVKDSSFVWLRPFLESLEDEGLLKLKPDVKDPTVTRINRSHSLICNWQPWAFSQTVGSVKTCGRR